MYTTRRHFRHESRLNTEDTDEYLFSSTGLAIFEQQQRWVPIAIFTPLAHFC